MTCSRKFGKQFSDVNHDPGFLLSSQYTFKYTRIKFGINMIVIKKWSGQNTWKGISYKKKTIWSQIIKDSNLIRDHGNAYIQQRDDSTHTHTKNKKNSENTKCWKKGTKQFLICCRWESNFIQAPLKPVWQHLISWPSYFPTT